MARLSAAIIVAVFVVLILGVSGDGKAIEKRDVIVTMSNEEFFNSYCQHSTSPAITAICNFLIKISGISTSTTTTTTTSTTADDPDTSGATSNTVQSSTTTAADIQTTTLSATALERAHWCRFNNGTYVPLGFTFMYTECTLCQCLQSHSIGCTTLQCMPTYCIDGSTPSPRQGQCCAQCAYEKVSTACIISGINFPHGAVLKKTGDNVECWCQLGSVECRKATVSLFSSLDFWGEGSAVYVVVIIICVLLLVGTLLCCACTLFFYYYYQRNQQATQQAYEEYYNNAGWQPMPDEGEAVVDASAEEKQAEAEQNGYEQEYTTGHSEEYIPPPYALYNASYVNEQNEKDEKYM